MINKTAILFGASGLVGSQLLQQLLKDNRYNTIICYVRGPLNIYHPKLLEKEFDFLEMEGFNPTIASSTDIFCCLGTTIKKAGTQEEFRKVDFELPVKIGKVAHAAGIENYIVISSIGANKNSRNFYLRTKGEMETAIFGIGIKNLHFVRPSLLMGERKEYRLGERLAQVLSPVMNVLLIGKLKKYRSISSLTVARAMLALANTHFEKVIVEPVELRRLATQS